MAWGDDDAADRERCAKENIHYCESEIGRAVV